MIRFETHTYISMEITLSLKTAAENKSGKTKDF